MVTKHFTYISRYIREVKISLKKKKKELTFKHFEDIKYFVNFVEEELLLKRSCSKSSLANIAGVVVGQ